MDKISNEILLIRGYTWDYEDCINMYDVEKDEWHTKIVIPFSLDGDVVSIDNKLYYFERKYTEKENGKHIFKISIRVFDLITRECLTSEQSWGSTAGVWDGLIYFYNQTESTFYCYEPEKNSVKMLGSTIGNFGFNYGLVNRTIHDGEIYIIGEARYEETKYSISEVFNIKTNKSKRIASFSEELPEGATITVTIFNNKLYAVMTHSLENLYVYSFDKNEWELIECYSRPAAKESTLISCQNKLICVDYRMLLHIYNPKKNEWESRIDYNGPMRRMCYVHTINNPHTK